MNTYAFSYKNCRWWRGKQKNALFIQGFVMCEGAYELGLAEWHQFPSSIVNSRSTKCCSLLFFRSPKNGIISDFVDNCTSVLHIFHQLSLRQHSSFRGRQKKGSRCFDVACLSVVMMQIATFITTN